MSYTKDQTNENILIETTQVERKYDIISIVSQRDVLLAEVAKLNLIIAEAEKLGVKLEQTVEETVEEPIEEKIVE